MSPISFTGTASFTRRVLTVAAMSGALSVATLGVAGQAGAATTSTTSGGQAHPQLCTNANGRRAHGAKLVAVSTGRLNRIKAMEAKAQGAGHSKRAAYLEKVINHDQAVLARQSGRYTASQARVAKAAAARCRSKS
jgi:hypothetical protein